MNSHLSVLALVQDEAAVGCVLPWASSFARARESSLTVVCWTYAAAESEQVAEEAGGDLVQAVRDFCSKAGSPVMPEVIASSGPSAAKAALAVARERPVDLLVAAADDPTGSEGATLATNPLLKQSPCRTAILFGGAGRSTHPRSAFVGASDNPHDGAAVHLANQLAEHCDTQVTVSRAETDAGAEGEEVGRLELQQLMRDAGVASDGHLECQVFQAGDSEGPTKAMDEHDLVLVGANDSRVAAIVEQTNKPTIAVIKRAPPLRPWQKVKRPVDWNTRLSPADYADLIGGLRRGSRLGADFVTMLSLATVVASLGLLQNSPAVVIGSMLLAPLMTPMIGCGLALAQANPRLGNMALRTVAAGLMCTLVISYVVGVITPGSELTPQIYARGEPTVLDLVIALASAAAASYALARPNLVGSIAGVAIATALVPPLCSVGISLAYHDVTNAKGAALLFGTNFLAIVLSAAFTFRLIGISSKQSGVRQKFWVFRVVAIFGVAAILVCIPLQDGLVKSLVETKPQPRAFPLTKAVMDELEERIETEPGVKLIAAGRPSSPRVAADVIIVIGSTVELDPAFADELVAVVRKQMKDQSLVVEVHCVSEQWQEMSPSPPGTQ